MNYRDLVCLAEDIYDVCGGNIKKYNTGASELTAHLWDRWIYYYI